MYSVFPKNTSDLLIIICQTKWPGVIYGTLGTNKVWFLLYVPVTSLSIRRIMSYIRAQDPGFRVRCKGPGSRVQGWSKVRGLKFQGSGFTQGVKTLCVCSGTAKRHVHDLYIFRVSNQSFWVSGAFEQAVGRAD